MSKKIYFSTSNHPKIVGLAQSMQLVEADSHWLDSSSTGIFDLLGTVGPDVVFLKDDDYKIEHIEYAKADFPNTKFVLLTEKNETHEIWDAVIYLNDDTNELFLPHLAYDLYSNGTANKINETDILVISNNIDLENQNALKWIFSIASKYRLKIYGDQKVMCPYYLGSVPSDLYKDLFASTKIVLMFDEQWLQTTLLNGKVPLVFNKNPSTHCEFSNYSQLEKLCEVYIAHDMDTIKIKPTTYLDFCRKVLEVLY